MIDDKGYYEIVSVMNPRVNGPSMIEYKRYINPDVGILKYRIEGDMPEEVKQCDGCGGRKSIFKNNKKQCVFCGNDL